MILSSAPSMLNFRRQTILCLWLNFASLMAFAIYFHLLQFLVNGMHINYPWFTLVQESEDGEIAASHERLRFLPCIG